MTPNPRPVEVSLTPHFEKFIKRKIKSGTYSDASHVVLAALQRLEQDEAIPTMVDEPESASTKAKVLLGLAEIERGDCIEIRSNAEMKAFLEDVIIRGRERLKRKKPSK